MVYWQRDKCCARSPERIGTGNGASTAASRRRDLSASLVFFFFISSSPFSFSLPRASATRFAESKAPAEMRRVATREWNIIARDSSAVVVVAQLLHEVLSRKITEILSFRFYLAHFRNNILRLGKKKIPRNDIYLKIDDSTPHIL